MKSALEVVTDAREAVSKLQRKAFSAVLTRAQAKNVLNSSKATCDGSSAVGYGNNSPEPPGDGTDLDKAETKAKGNETLRGSLLVDQVDPTKYSSLAKLCGVISYFRRAVKKWLTLVRGASMPVKWEAAPKVQELEVAFQDLCLAAQNGVTFPVTTINRLVVSRDEVSGLLLCSGRVQTISQERIGVPLIPYKAWVSTLLTREAHEVNHEGVAGTILRARAKAWVVQGSRIARKVINSCMHCRKTKARMCKQIMSELPVERTEPAAPFEFTALDLFGPYIVKDVVKRRTRMKVWGVVYSCMASRAVHADVVEDLSTEGFMKAYLRFTALRGHPRKLWSDQGTNFVGARPMLQELYEFLMNIDKNLIQKNAAAAGTDWSWEFHPADSPHRNGAAEASVRILKKALGSVGEGGNLTTLEFQTLLYLAANLSNERPIGARIQVQDEAVEVITPNSLLLGRARSKGDTCGFEYPSYPVVRLRAVQIEVDKFWKRWSQLAGPGLFIRQKWHAPVRNVEVGDLVWIADQNAIRVQFKLGRIVDVCPDTHGVVRDVRVKTCQSFPVSDGQLKRDQVRGNLPLYHPT
ncbi:F-box/WD repeat-containing protein 4 isoform X2 [Festucalex cinctus]